MTAIARQLRIIGKVQGVFYRVWATKVANDLGLTGWVRNRTDGDVEAHVQGEEMDVERFILMAWSGPRGARVEDVWDEAAEMGDFTGFEQRLTV